MRLWKNARGRFEIITVVFSYMSLLGVEESRNVLHFTHFRCSKSYLFKWYSWAIQTIVARGNQKYWKKTIIHIYFDFWTSTSVKEVINHLIRRAPGAPALNISIYLINTETLWWIVSYSDISKTLSLHLLFLIMCAFYKRKE